MSRTNRTPTAEDRAPGAIALTYIRVSTSKQATRVARQWHGTTLKCVPPV